MAEPHLNLDATSYEYGALAMLDYTLRGGRSNGFVFVSVNTADNEQDRANDFIDDFFTNYSCHLNIPHTVSIEAVAERVLETAYPASWLLGESNPANTANNMLVGKIDEPSNDDVRVQRDRLLALLQNLDLPTQDARHCTRILHACVDEIEKTTLGKPRNIFHYAWLTVKRYIFQ